MTMTNTIINKCSSFNTAIVMNSSARLAYMAFICAAMYWFFDFQTAFVLTITSLLCLAGEILAMIVYSTVTGKDSTYATWAADVAQLTAFAAATIGTLTVKYVTDRQSVVLVTVSTVVIVMSMYLAGGYAGLCIFFSTMYVAGMIAAAANQPKAE